MKSTIKLIKRVERATPARSDEAGGAAPRPDLTTEHRRASAIVAGWVEEFRQRRHAEPMQAVERLFAAIEPIEPEAP